MVIFIAECNGEKGMQYSSKSITGPKEQKPVSVLYWVYDTDKLMTPTQ